MKKGRINILPLINLFLFNYFFDKYEYIAL